MSFRRARQNRYEKYLSKGFLPREAQFFSEIKDIPPYLKSLIHSRTSLATNAKRYKWSKERYRRYIKDFYRKHDALYTDGPRYGQIDPWRLLRNLEDNYKDTEKDYETPQGKKKTKSRDYDDRGIKKRKRR